MEKITFPVRSFLIILFLLGSSLTFLTATNKHSAEISITESVTNVSCYGQNDGTINTTITGGTGNYSISWNTGQTTEDISNLTAGSYVITVTDENNSATKSIEVTESDVLTMAAPATTPVSCNGGSDGTIIAGAVSGGNSGYTYSKNGTNFSSSNSFGGLSAGSYTLTVKDDKGCTATATATISQPDALTMAAPTTTPVSCNGGSDGTITAGAVTGGNIDFQYSIDGGAFSNSKTFNGLSQGSHTITVKDSKGCEASETITVNQPDALNMGTPTTTTESCNGGADGTITAGAVSGGNGGFTYQLNDGSFVSGSKFENLSVDFYTITVKDAKGCEFISDPIEITGPAELSADVSFTPVSCKNGTDGSIQITNPQGGYGSFEYSIDDETTWQSNGSFNNLSAGTYKILVRDVTFPFCKIILETAIEVPEPTALSLSTATVTPVSCNGGSDGTITAGAVSGGNTDYTYSIDGTNFAPSNSFDGLSKGTYTVTVRDSKNCSVTQSIEVTQPDILTASVSSENISCNGTSDGSISITDPQGGSGTYQYSINGGSKWQDSVNFTGLSKGTYSISIRDKEFPDCSVLLENSLVITEPSALQAEFSFTNITCNTLNDGSITVSNFSGGYGTYEFSHNNGSSWQVSNEFEGLSNGFYSILVRDKENPGCVINIASNLEIIKPSPLDGDITSINITCNGSSDGSIIISNPSGGYNNFEYSLDSSTWQSNAEFENLRTGTYNVYLRDADNPSCFVMLSSTIEISEPEILASSITSSNVLCNGLATGEVTAAAKGGTAPYTFSWGSLGEGVTKTDLPAGTYSVTVTDANGCATAPLDVIVTEPDSFIEITNVLTTSGCFQTNNGTATVEATGGTGSYSYLWSNGQTAKQATGLAPGNHTVTITDENGCSKDRTVTVSTPTQLQITGFLTTETTSFGSATGSATAQVSGGTPNYIFSWSDGQTGQTASNLPAGKYTVTVTDINGCTAKKDVNIVDSLDAEIIPTSICKNENDIIRTSSFKIANLTARGGTAPYSYKWTFQGDASIQTATGPQTPNITYGTIGDKFVSVTITDINGLSLTQNIIQYVGGCFSTDCGSNDLKVDNFYIGDSNGNKITTANCSTADQKFIYIHLPSNPNRYSLNVEYIYSVENLSTNIIKTYKEVGCFYEQIDIPLNAQTIPIDYTCGDKVTIEGIYLTFANNKNTKCGEGNKPKCYSTNDGEPVTSPLFAVAFPNELLCNGASNGRISVRASGGTSPYQYKLVNAINGAVVRVNQPSEVFENIEAGIYDVIVSDSDDPVNTFTVEDVEITQPTNPLTVEEVGKTPVTCFGGTDGTATVLASGGTPSNTGEPYIYVWENGQTTATVTNLAAGDYNVRVIDANGCEDNITVNVSQPEQLLAVAGPDQVLTCGTTSTTLQAQFTSENEEEFGTWTIVNGPSGGSFADINDPQTIFTGTQGTYTLRWSVPCGASDDVKISISNCNNIDFDGINDHIVFDDNFNLPDNFALEAWVKQNPSTSSGIKTIMSKRNLSNLSEGGFDLIVENNIPKFRWNNSSLISQYPIGTDRWYHIAVIKGGADEGLYVDGIKVNAGGTSPGIPSAISQPFIMGAGYNLDTPLTPKNYFHGWIEEVRIWNTAITTEQQHFMMNQKLQENSGKVRGVEIPLNTPGNLSWNLLAGYYQLEFSENGLTPGKISGSPSGKLINITTNQQRTAPLPYISSRPGKWYADATWLRPQVWDPPGSKGIDGSTIIEWNIAQISHNISSGGKNITLLGLLSKSAKLTIANPNEALNEKNSGQALTITHYLKLNGIIDLVGESQLIQTDIADSETNQTITSVLEESSIGYIERAQQGTANSFNYNYWSSPVSLQGAANNSTYTVKSVMMDGSPTSNNGETLSFNNWHEYADGAFSNPRKISNYWINKFRGTANVYSEWQRIGSTGILNAGEGYTMKGTSGKAAIEDRQNYVFKGKPNNGTIALEIQPDQNYLLGNPYPSAIDINKFILDNLNAADVDGGTNTQNVFNGAVYFWDHYAGGDTHILLEYIGGYATRNLLEGVPAISNDNRIDNSDLTPSSNEPGQFIPVAQGFFINSVIDPEIAGDISVDGGDVLFKNSQRVFVRESSGNTGNSVFLRPEEHTKQAAEIDTRPKIRLDFKSPKGYYRQILVGVDANASNGFDLGYDALMNDYNLEDMYWIIGDREFVIQGVSNFDLTQVLPLGIRIDQEGEIMIKINELKNIGDGVDIFLKDKVDSTYYDLRESEVKLNLTKGEIIDRFEIVFEKEKENTPDPDEETDPTETPGEEPDPNEGTDPDPVENPDKILPPGTIDIIFAEDDHQLRILNPDEMNIQQVEIFNLLGQKIEMFTTDSNKNQLDFPVQEHPSAIYVVKVFAKEGMVSKNILMME